MEPRTKIVGVALGVVFAQVEEFYIGIGIITSGARRGDWAVGLDGCCSRTFVDVDDFLPEDWVYGRWHVGCGDWEGSIVVATPSLEM